MTTNYPPELQQAIIARSGAQSALSKSLVQGKRKMSKAKQRPTLGAGAAEVRRAD